MHNRSRHTVVLTAEILTDTIQRTIHYTFHRCNKRSFKCALMLMHNAQYVSTPQLKLHRGSTRMPIRQNPPAPFADLEPTTPQTQIARHAHALPRYCERLSPLAAGSQQEASKGEIARPRPYHGALACPPSPWTGRRATDTRLPGREFGKRGSEVLSS